MESSSRGTGNDRFPPVLLLQSVQSSFDKVDGLLAFESLLIELFDIIVNDGCGSRPPAFRFSAVLAEDLPPPG
jgi:hypothetical protein